jgi:hypothetical protein
MEQLYSLETNNPSVGREFPSRFTQLNVSLPSSKKPYTGIYLEQHEEIHLIILLWATLIIYSPLRLISKVAFSLKVTRQHCLGISHLQYEDYF